MVGLGLCLSAAARVDEAPGKNPLRNAYFGDLHLHTSYSFDAYLWGVTGLGPDEAYRFAKGEAVDYMGEWIRRRDALDFMAVTDHAENIGVFQQLEDPASAVSQSDWGRIARADFDAIMDARKNPTDAARARRSGDLVLAYSRGYFFGHKNMLPTELKAQAASAWTRLVASANRHYTPGTFTTFIAYEWTSTPHGSNLHRNVIFKGDRAPYPFTALDSKRPEDLWAWLEAIRAQGIDALAIPHNANMSNGLMYDWIDSDGLRVDRASALRRQANEPLSEIIQSKGASETHPLLSPNDELARFEIVDRGLATPQQPSRPQGSYLRDALGRGIVIQRRAGANPYKYGFVAGSDLHSGLSVSDENNYRGDHFRPAIGKVQATSADAAALLGGKGYPANNPRLLGSGALTGVWAESNTRESIYDALRRRETFATSGTKLRLRFFGGWQFQAQVTREKDWTAAAYRDGVPMGGDLPSKPDGATAPSFVVWAAKDADGAALDRIQVIKVWEEGSEHKESLFNVAFSDKGASELKAVWTDPAFDPARFSAYYIRVLEKPTPRWTTLMAREHGLPQPDDVAAYIQERGWSSPIWYTPTP